MNSQYSKCPDLPVEMWILILSFINGFTPIPIKLSSKMLCEESEKLDNEFISKSILNDILLKSWLELDRKSGTIHTAVTVNGKDTIYVPHYNVLSIKNGIAKLFFY